jgi:hypothetical protein
VKNELKVIGHMSDPNSTSPDILSDGPGKDILRPDTFDIYFDIGLTDTHRDITSWRR